MYRMNKFPPISMSRHLWIIFLWNFLILMYFEVLMRFLTVGPDINVLSSGLFNTLQFSFSLTLLILCFICLFSERYHYIVSVIWMMFLFIVFSSQLLYHDIFRTFYYFQSIENVGQGLGFKHVIYSTILKNLWWILLSLLIIFLFIFIQYKRLKKYQTRFYSWKTKGLFMFCFLGGFIIFHLIAVWNIKTDERARDVYYDMYASNLSVEKLGLLTTVRLDVQRNLTNWSPKIDDLPVVEAPVTGNDSSVEDVDDENIDESDERDDKDDYDEQDWGENTLDIPFERLMQRSENEEIAQMHEYFSYQNPTKKNEFTGKYEGYNLIWITAEAYAPYAVDEELTPTLHKLSKEGYQFTNFYNPIWGVSTSDGEYTILNSLVPKPGVWSFSESGHNDVPFVIGNQLKNSGYETKAYHNHTYDYYDRDISHPNMGYDYKGVGNGLNISKMWPESDLEMMEATIDEYIDQEPFHVYYMTVSGHLEYNFIGNNIAMKNEKYVDHLNLSDQAKAYLAGQIELDRALELLMDQLDEADVLDNTLIAMTGDHYPYGLDNETIEELTGEPLDEKFGIYENEWILYATDMEDEDVVVEEPTYTLDMLPTISNLMGIDFDSRLLMGRDVFSEKEPLVVFEDKSFLTEQVKYYYPDDEVTSLTGEKVDKDHLERMKRRTDEIFYYSAKILEHDYYSTLEWDGK